MSEPASFRRYLAELVVIFIGVGLAFAVENLREDLNERSMGEQYLSGFRQDLTADLGMLQDQLDARRKQLQGAKMVLEFFDGRPVNPQIFFEAFGAVMPSWNTTPNRNTMVEVQGSGNLRLIRDPRIRTALLNLYTSYENIGLTEAHIARDFDAYLYDPTFSSIPIQIHGPWADTEENRQRVETLLSDIRVENGIRLAAYNLEVEDYGLIDELELARSQVEALLQMLPEP